MLFFGVWNFANRKKKPNPSKQNKTPPKKKVIKDRYIELVPVKILPKYRLDIIVKYYFQSVEHAKAGERLTNTNEKKKSNSRVKEKEKKESKRLKEKSNARWNVRAVQFNSIILLYSFVRFFTGVVVLSVCG